MQHSHVFLSLHSLSMTRSYRLINFSYFTIASAGAVPWSSFVPSPLSSHSKGTPCSCAKRYSASHGIVPRAFQFDTELSAQPRSAAMSTFDRRRVTSPTRSRISLINNCGGFGGFKTGLCFSIIDDLNKEYKPLKCVTHNGKQLQTKEFVWN